MLITQFTQNLRPHGTVCYHKSRDKRQNGCFDYHLCSQQIYKYCKLFQQFGEEEKMIMHGDFKYPLNPSIDRKGGLLNPRKAVISTICNLQELMILRTKVKNPCVKTCS